MVGKFSGHGTKTNIRAVAPRVCVCIYSYIGSVVWSNASFMLALSHSLLMSIHVRGFYVCSSLFSFALFALFYFLLEPDDPSPMHPGLVKIKDTGKSNCSAAPTIVL